MTLNFEQKPSFKVFAKILQNLPKGSVYYDGRSSLNFQCLDRQIHLGFTLVTGITSMWFKNEILKLGSISSVGLLVKALDSVERLVEGLGSIPRGGVSCRRGWSAG